MQRRKIQPQKGAEGSARQRRNQRSADILVRSGDYRLHEADKNVRAPGNSSRHCRMLTYCSASQANTGFELVAPLGGHAFCRPSGGLSINLRAPPRAASLRETGRETVPPANRWSAGPGAASSGRRHRPGSIRAAVGGDRSAGPFPGPESDGALQVCQSVTGSFTTLKRQLSRKERKKAQRMSELGRQHHSPAG